MASLILSVPDHCLSLYFGSSLLHDCGDCGTRFYGASCPATKWPRQGHVTKLFKSEIDGWRNKQANIEHTFHDALIRHSKKSWWTYPFLCLVLKRRSTKLEMIVIFYHCLLWISFLLVILFRIAWCVRVVFLEFLFFFPFWCSGVVGGCGVGGNSLYLM